MLKNPEENILTNLESIQLLKNKNTSMFYGAHTLIFKKAEELRNKQTPAEIHLWNNIGHGQLDIKFRRQHPAAIYVLDFYAHKIKLAVEIDGSVHAEESVKRNDFERQRFLESLGIHFIRFTNKQVLTEVNTVLDKIKREIETLYK